MIDTVRLKLQVYEKELFHCFEDITEEEFIKHFGKTPAQGFDETLSFWVSVDEQNVLSEVVTVYGEDYYNDIFANDTRTSQEILRAASALYNKYKTGGNQMSTHRVVIHAFSLASAENIKGQIEEKLPFLVGQITVVTEPEITTLDKIIEADK